MIIWGTEDKALDTIMAEQSLLLCENAQLRRIEGASHWVQNVGFCMIFKIFTIFLHLLQDAPQECHAFMWEFLRK